MSDPFAPVLSAVISSSVFASLLGIVFLRRSKQIEAEIKLRMDRVAATATSQRQWKERAITDLLGPVYMQLDRTRRAFDRWTTKNLFLEAKVIREGNLAIRDLLLQKGHLIPPELLEDAGLLVKHYDRWLEEYEKQRLAEHPDLDAPFERRGRIGGGCAQARGWAAVPFRRFQFGSRNPDRRTPCRTRIRHFIRSSTCGDTP